MDRPRKYYDPAPINATPEEVARVMTNTRPKKRWRFMDGQAPPSDEHVADSAPEPSSDPADAEEA